MLLMNAARQSWTSSFLRSASAMLAVQPLQCLQKTTVRLKR